MATREVCAGWHLGSARLRGLVAAAALASIAPACYSPSPAPGLPCTEDRQCPDDQVCSPLDVCVAAGSVRALQDDSEDDFREDGAELTNAVITSRGFVESQPWMNHGLRVASFEGIAFEDPTIASWDDLQAMTPKGQGYLYSSSIGWGDMGTPAGLSLTKGVDVTVLLEGEVFLDAGTWKLELRADDNGFIDLADPGATNFRRLMTTTFAATASTTYDVKTAGWHPVRLAFINRTSAGNISLRGSINGVPGNFDASRLRAAVPERAQGLVLDAFDSPSLLHFRSSSVTSSVTDLSYGNNSPPDSGISTATAYSLRWSGQFYVKTMVDGFTVATAGGGHRVWVDGQLRADRLAASSGSSDLVALGLSPGWHDLVIDLDKRATAPTTMKISGIIGDQDAFDAENLRPVLGPAQRWLGGRTSLQGTDATIPEPPAVLSRQIFLPNIAGTVNAVTVEYALDHTAQTELTLSARSPLINRTLAAAGTLTGTAFARLRYALNPRDFQVSPGSTWTLTVADTVAAMGTGTLTELAVGVAYTDTSTSSLPYAPVTTYVSAPRDLKGDVVAFGKITAKLNNVEGVTAEVSIRSGSTAEECLAAQWAAVDDNNTTLALPNRYVQYRVSMTTNGLISAALDRFTLEYYTKD